MSAKETLQNNIENEMRMMQIPESLIPNVKTLLKTSQHSLIQSIISDVEEKRMKDTMFGHKTLGKAHENGYNQAISDFQSMLKELLKDK